jgi:hypothetical protein
MKVLEPIGPYTHPMTAMTRASEGFNDSKCLKCSGVVSQWESAAEQTDQVLKREGWCSWCFDNTTHTMDRKAKAKRDHYTCSSCGMSTCSCMKCDEGMTRGGLAWDDALCAQCSRETGKGGWKELKERKDKVFNELRDENKVKAELVSIGVYRVISNSYLAKRVQV